MSNEVNQLINAFSAIGARVPMWTQAQGSNLSYKDLSNNLMLIKPSGFRLDQIRDPQDLVGVDLVKLKNGIGTLFLAQQSDEELQYSNGINAAQIPNPKNLRPSMETGFHYVLTNPYVFHFHSVIAVLMAHRIEKHPDVLKWLQNKLVDQKIAVVSYGTPGLDLSRLLGNYSSYEIILLKNHGVILNTNTPIELLAIWSALEADFSDKYLGDRRLPSMPLSELTTAFDKPQRIRILFPDLAVFLPKLKLCLDGKADGTYSFKKELIATHKDAYEIWMSFCILNTLAPDLKEIDESESAKIMGLPTEQYRIMKTEKPG